MQIRHILNPPITKFSNFYMTVERFPSTEILRTAQVLDVNMLLAELFGT